MNGKDREMTIITGNIDVFVNGNWSQIKLGSGETRT